MTEDLARYLFDQQADDYDADPAMRELAWADPNIVYFWIEQAKGILEFLSREGALNDSRH